MQFSSISLVIGFIFSPIAAAMVFLITYGEYSHHYADNKKPRWFALEAAVLTFILFMTLSFLIGLVLEGIANR